MSSPLTLIEADRYQPESQGLLQWPNDADVQTADLSGVRVVELHFPKFTDGRAFSQARQLRQRRQFAGIVRATGDVLIDQLQQMQRCGFDEAVLRADQNAAHVPHLAGFFPQFYQGDARCHPPRFATAGADNAHKGEQA